MGRNKFRIPPKIRKAVALTALCGGLVGLAAAGLMLSGDRKQIRTEGTVRNVLLDRNTREVSLDAIESSLKKLSRENRDLSRQVSSLQEQLDRQAYRSGLKIDPTALDHRLSSMNRQLQVMQDQLRRLDHEAAEGALRRSPGTAGTAGEEGDPFFASLLEEPGKQSSRGSGGAVPGVDGATGKDTGERTASRSQSRSQSQSQSQSRQQNAQPTADQGADHCEGGRCGEQAGARKPGARSSPDPAGGRGNSTTVPTPSTFPGSSRGPAHRSSGDRGTAGISNREGNPGSRSGAPGQDPIRSHPALPRELLPPETGSRTADSAVSRARGGRIAVFSVPEDTAGQEPERTGDGKSASPGGLYLPAGSILSGVFINGMDAPTGTGQGKDQFPALIRIKREAVLPNRHRSDVRECFLIVSGYGDLSSERAYLRGELLSCVAADGRVLEGRLDSYVVGPDGFAGIRGRLVSKQGQIIAKSLMSGFLSGLSGAFDVKAVPSLNTAGGSSVAYESLYSPRALQGAAASGISSSLGKVADFYLKIAEGLYPVIEIAAGRNVEVIVSRGTYLELMSPGRSAAAAAGREAARRDREMRPGRESPSRDDTRRRGT